MSLRGLSGRRRSSGFLGGLLLVVVAIAVLVFLAVLAALSLFVIALVGVVMGVERLVGLLVPAYRRRRRDRYVSVPRGLIRTIRFGSEPTQVIEAHSYELPHKGD